MKKYGMIAGCVGVVLLCCIFWKCGNGKQEGGPAPEKDEETVEQSETEDLSQEEEVISEAEDSLMDMEGYLHVDADEDGLDWGVYDRLTCSCFPYEYEEIPYADENTFQAVKDAYEEIDYLGECMPVSEADREKALEKFARLMRNEMPFTDADTGEKRYVKDLQYYERYYNGDWRYYLWDIDGDGILEACIDDKYEHFLDGQNYIFKYSSETDNYYRWKTCYTKGTVTVKGVHIENGGSFFYPGYDNIIQEFTRINPDGDPILNSFFFAARDPMLTSKHREYIYMAMIPWYADPEKKVPVTEEMKQQGIYEKKTGQWYFRITEEQFEELEKSYEEAWKTAKNKMEEEWMTYEELISCKDSYELAEYPYTLDTGFTFTALRVTGMKNRELEKKINDSLSSYFFILEEPIWFDEKNVAERPYIIHCRTNRYLSIEYQFDNLFSDLASDAAYHHCVTVDMQTGELIRLENLVKVDAAFARHVKYGNILHQEASEFMGWTEEESSKELNRTYSVYGIDTILNIFKKYTSEFLYGDIYRELHPGMGPACGSVALYVRDYFYIEDGKIYMQNGGFHDDIFWIETKDIEDYLLVPAW